MKTNFFYKKKLFFTQKITNKHNLYNAYTNT